MPTYEYECRECSAEFMKVMSMAEYAQARVSCPACGSERISRKFSPVYAKTSKKS